MTKLEPEPVISEFICSDPVSVFLFSMCCFVLTLARTTYFIKWSKLQGRASLESGSFLYHIKHSAGMPQVYITAAQRKLRHCRGCGREETKDNTVVMVKKKNKQFFFPWKMTVTYLKPKICIALKSFYTQYFGVSRWCRPLKSRSISMVF